MDRIDKTEATSVKDALAEPANLRADGIGLFVQEADKSSSEQRLKDLFIRHFGDAYVAGNAKTVVQQLAAGEAIKPRFNRRGVEYLMLVEGEVLVNGRRLNVGEIVRLDPGEILSATANACSRLVSHIHPYHRGLTHRTFGRPRMPEKVPVMSVVVIAKDIQHHICHCLLSCMNQTYPKMQIIVVDDGSSDDTLRKCISMASHDYRVEVYSRNLGRNGVRRFGVSKATGDYIVIIDGDDWLNEDAIEILARTASEQSSECLVYGYDYYSDRSQQVWGPTYPSDVPLKSPPLYYERNDRSAYEVSTHNHTIWMYVFSRSLAAQVCDALIDVHLYEDLPFYLVMMGMSRNPVLCNYVLYHYRRDRVGQTTEKWTEVKAAHKLSCLQVALDYVRASFPMDDRFMQLILLYKVERIVVHEIEVCRANGHSEAARAWEAFWKAFVRLLNPGIEQHVIEQSVREKVVSAWVGAEKQLPPASMPALAE